MRLLFSQRKNLKHQTHMKMLEAFSLSAPIKIIQTQIQTPSVAAEKTVSKINFSPTSRTLKHTNQNLSSHLRPTYVDPTKGMVFGGVFGSVGGMFVGTIAGAALTKNSRFLPLLGMLMIGGTAVGGSFFGAGGFLYGKREERAAKGWRDDGLQTLQKDIAALLRF